VAKQSRADAQQVSCRTLFGAPGRQIGEPHESWAADRLRRGLFHTGLSGATLDFSHDTLGPVMAGFVRMVLWSPREARTVSIC
jgi:hypothetical protein